MSKEHKERQILDKIHDVKAYPSSIISAKEPLEKTRIFELLIEGGDKSINKDVSPYLDIIQEEFNTLAKAEEERKMKHPFVLLNITTSYLTLEECTKYLKLDEQPYVVMDD